VVVIFVFSACQFGEQIGSSVLFPSDMFYLGYFEG